MALEVPFKGGQLEFENIHAESLRTYRAGEVKGLLYHSPVADGAAYYRVVKAEPLTVERLPVGDSWSLPAPHVRGLELFDIQESVRRDIALEELFRSKR